MTSQRASEEARMETYVCSPQSGFTETEEQGEGRRPGKVGEKTVTNISRAPKYHQA